MKEYLGDAVYAKYNSVLDCIVLTTEDGINTANTIVLEPDVWQALKEFAKRSIEL